MLLSRRMRAMREEEPEQVQTPKPAKRPDLSALPRTELVALAEARGVKGASRMNKARLVEAIEEG